jgi:putative tricarboxylic transport membrane protein
VIGRLVIAAALVGLGLLMGTEAAGFRAIGAAPASGPAIFPTLVASGLVTIGLLLGITEWRAARAGATPPQREAPFDWRGVLLVGAGVVAFTLLIQPVGFVVAAAALFALVARGFGSRRLARDAVTGLALGAVAYAAFTKGLGLTLPGGPW